MTTATFEITEPFTQVERESAHLTQRRVCLVGRRQGIAWRWFDQTDVRA
jgi:hypothetical protein